LAHCRVASIQVFTGASPFSNPSSFATALAIVEGKRPQQPTHPAFTEDLWALVQRCWDQDPHLRPEVPEVLELLRGSSVSQLFLQQLRRLDMSSPEFRDQLSKVLYGEEYRQRALKLQGGDLVWLIDYMDKVCRHATSSHPLLKPEQALDGLDPSSPIFRKCLRELRNICGTRAILPTSYTLSSPPLNIGPEPFAFGPSSDAFPGTLNETRVCIKRLRVHSRDDSHMTAKVC